MNYYEHHIGDYAEATSHLSFAEDAAYSRLIRKYYSTERPLPADAQACQRLIGARTDEERAAVDVVLREFFVLKEDGWHNNRCDQELDLYRQKRSKAQRSANARWLAHQSHSDRNAKAMRSHSETDANALRTQCEGNALQSPVPSPQSPDTGAGDARARDANAMRTQCERMAVVSHGTRDAGDALTRLSSAEDALAEVQNAWRDIADVDEQSMTSWLAHWSRVHAGREMPGHQRIAAAKLLAGLGDADTQRRAVATAEANGWKALRFGDGKAPPKSKTEVAADARKESERLEWANLRERAQRIGFRPPSVRDDLGGYRTLLERAEANQPRRGSLSVSELLAGKLS